jgi:hypothetical protein
VVAGVGQIPCQAAEGQGRPATEADITFPAGFRVARGLGLSRPVSGFGVPDVWSGFDERRWGR